MMYQHPQSGRFTSSSIESVEIDARKASRVLHQVNIPDFGVYIARICSHPVASVATECAVPQGVLIVGYCHRHVLGTGALLE